MKKIILSAFSVLLITSCISSKNIPQNYAAHRFVNEAPIKLNANEINIVSEHSPTFMRPNVEHLLPVSIEKSAKVWAQDMLVATNPLSDNKAIFTIKNASVVEELVKSDKILEKDRLKYKANLSVELKVKNASNLSSAQTQIQAWRELTIPYDTPLIEKEMYWNDMVKKLVNDMSVQMQKNANEYLAQYIAK